MIRRLVALVVPLAMVLSVLAGMSLTHPAHPATAGPVPAAQQESARTAAAPERPVDRLHPRDAAAPLAGRLPQTRRAVPFRPSPPRAATPVAAGPASALTARPTAPRTSGPPTADRPDRTLLQTFRC